MADSDDSEASDVAEGGDTKKRTRTRRPQRPFPASPFEDALEFAKKIYATASGQSVRRLTLFDELGKAPDSGASRMLVTNANRYGLTTGSYNSEQIGLTPDGLKAVSEGISPREVARTRVKLAIENIDPFNTLYQSFQNTRLPATSVLKDKLKELEVADEFLDEGVETFIVNIRFVGLLKTLSGADRIVNIDHLLDGLPSSPTDNRTLRIETQPHIEPPQSLHASTGGSISYDQTCFYVTPIGEEGSAERKHSDLFLGSIVEPAVSGFGLTVLRADAIDQPGTITRQVIEYIVRSRLIIADLSFHNPNVFYELALRHATGKPIVQIVRYREDIPFDIKNMRTVRIDDSDIYSFVPKLEAYRADVAAHVRRALEETTTSDNPITAVFRDFAKVITTS